MIKKEIFFELTKFLFSEDVEKNKDLLVEFDLIEDLWKQIHSEFQIISYNKSMT